MSICKTLRVLSVHWNVTQYSPVLQGFSAKPSDFEFQLLVAQSYGGPQLSHQDQMLTVNYESLTSNSNRSQQIQIAHSELLRWPTTVTSKPNAYSKLQIAHSKFKSLTANYKLLTPLGVFGYLHPAVQLVQKYLSYMKPLLSKLRLCKPTRLLRFADGLCYAFIALL